MKTHQTLFSRLPFNWRSPLLYFIPLAIEYAASYCIVFTSSCNFAYDTGFCAYFLDFVDDIKLKTDLLNETVAAKEKHAILHKKLCEFIQAHAIRLELSVFFFVSKIF